MRDLTSLTAKVLPLMLLTVAAGGCSKMKDNDPREITKARAEAKRQQRACASPTAYDRLKDQLFDAAIASPSANRANLNTLADYSLVRVEDPVVKGWDAALDITRCKGRLIIDIPPGAERAFGGQRRLDASVEYTAQAAADGNGYVYQVKGAEPLIAKLAAFDLNGMAYRPPPAIDEPNEALAAAEPATLPRAEASSAPVAVPGRSVADEQVSTSAVTRPAPRPSPIAVDPVRQPLPRRSASSAGGEATVRAFYRALGEGNGQAASANVVPDKRTSRAFSPEAISRFYGRLPGPMQLGEVMRVGDASYRVRYRYSAGRTRCNGSAVVNLTNAGGRPLIRSIRALNGC